MEKGSSCGITCIAWANSKKYKFSTNESSTQANTHTQNKPRKQTKKRNQQNDHFIDSLPAVVADRGKCFNDVEDDGGRGGGGEHDDCTGMIGGLDEDGSGCWPTNSRGNCNDAHLDDSNEPLAA